MSFPDETKKKVWEKALAVEGFDPDIFRKDPCGAWIIFNKYGLRDNSYGWEIDQVFPETLGGDERLDNLRALHWRNKESKSDDFPSYIARVTSRENKNVECYKSFTVNTQLRQLLESYYKH